MPSQSETLHGERTDQVLALAAARLQPAQRPLVEAFGREYFHRLDTDDMLARTPEDLLGALLAHWQFGARRNPGETLVRVLSPAVAENGWASRHSVIDIVNDDMPFLVDTTTMEINRQGLTLHLIVHPIFAVERDAQGQLLSIAPRSETSEPPGTRHESWMHIEVDRMVDAAAARRAGRGPRARAARRAGRRRGLEADDGPHAPGHCRVRECAGRTARRAGQGEPGLPAMAGRGPHDRCSGYRCHDLVSEQGQDALQLVAGSGLGLLRETAQEKLSASFSALPPNARALARAPLPMLLITKANTRSTVHRPGYTDYVGIKRYNAAGEVIGEHRFIGLFTSTAYSARVAETPLLRGKVEAIAARAGLPPGGHSAKSLHHILETYPRDDLFQIIGRRPLRHRAGHPGARRAPAPAPVRLPRSLRPLRILPGLRAARDLFHRPAHQVPAHPGGRLWRQRRRVRRAAQRSDPGAHSLHRAHHAGPHRGDGPQGARGASSPPPRGAGTTSCAMP